MMNRARKRSMPCFNVSVLRQTMQSRSSRISMSYRTYAVCRCKSCSCLCHPWPEAVDPALWPSALKNYVNLRNSLPTYFVAKNREKNRIVTPPTYDQSPLSRLSGSEVEANLDTFSPFGCPV